MNHKTQGFTLIELLIAIAIFSIIALFATGSLVSVFSSNRKSNSLQSVITNLNFALEEMSREIRFGDTYHCGTTGNINQVRNCTSGDTYIAFKFDTDGNFSNEQVSYRFEEIATDIFELQKKVENGGWKPVVSGDVRITHGKFYVTGAGVTGPGAGLQPRITIVLHAESGTGKTKTEFTIQNTLTQRKEDI